MTIATPLEIPGCLGWLETDSDGTPQDQRRAHAGHGGEWVIYPLDDRRGIVLHYDRQLTPEERTALDEWRQRTANPADQATDSEAQECVTGEAPPS